MGKHTPGPWAALATNEIVAPNGRTIARAHRDAQCRGETETTANARLIAAAPELVEALKGLIRYADAVRHTAGMGKSQLERLEAAKALLSRIEGDA